LAAADEEVSEDNEQKVGVDVPLVNLETIQIKKRERGAKKGEGRQGVAKKGGIGVTDDGKDSECPL
jgi:hypothetical protein